MAHHDHDHECNCADDPNCGCGEHDDYEIEVVELEDENGEKEEFAILEELEFEGRNFCILAPLAEVQAQAEGKEEIDELSIEIFEVKDDEFTMLEDEDLAKRLLDHLDEIHAKLEAEEAEAEKADPKND